MYWSESDHVPRLDCEELIRFGATFECVSCGERFTPYEAKAMKVLDEPESE